MRFAIILLILLGIRTTEAQDTDHWTAWLRLGSDVVLIDSSGNELQRITLPVIKGHRSGNTHMSSDGQLISYMSSNESFDALQLRVYDTITNNLRLTYDLNYNVGVTEKNLFYTSNRFSLDSASLALAQHNGEPDGWRILVFDLSSGEIIHSLMGDTAPEIVKRLDGNEALMYRFADDTITFALAAPWNYPSGSDKTSQLSMDWHILSDTFTENCAYSHLDHGTFEPSGVVIESMIHPDLGYVPDSDIPRTPYALEFYDSETNWRQVFYKSGEFQPHSPTFVQNGERIVFWGNPYPENAAMRRLVLIERDGTIIDQLNVLGDLSITSTNNGFLYRAFYDVAGWETKLVYVNTRNDLPFAQQSVILESKPDESLRVLWAGSDNLTPIADFMPWADYMSYDPGCPPYRG
jgi:hypothetical protein